MKVAFLLSGEHPEIPKEEVKATLEALSVEYSVVSDMTSCLIVELSPSGELMEALSRRLAFTRSFGRLIALIRVEEFPVALDSVKPPEITGSFRVRSFRVGGCCSWLRRQELEAVLGGWVLRGNERARVNLEKPESELIAVMTSDRIAVYLKEGEVDRSLFKVKEVSARPYVHPASMRPTLARAMVNLARTRAGDLVLDPFLGVGGIGLEVLSVGGRLIGSDINEKLLVQAKNNFITYGFLEGYELLVGDALKLELNERVDRIVTDPPYGRMSSSCGYSPRELAVRFVRKVPDYLKSEGWISISLPSEFLSFSDFEDSGIEVKKWFDIREHKSLTRRVWVGKLA